MASEAVVNAVETRLAANWNKCPIVGVMHKDERPDESASFLAVQYPVANEDQISVGSPGANVWREEGAFRLVLSMNRDEEKVTMLQWADELRALYRGKHFDGVETFAPSPPAIDDRNDEGTFYILSIAVPYQYDLIG